MAGDSDEVTDGLRRASGMDKPSFALVLDRYRNRLRKAVKLRLDPRLRGRIDPSDAVQEALLEAYSRVEHYVSKRPMPFFIWLRFITMQKLLVLHRRHLGAQKRDARRDISIYRSTTPAASSAVVAAQLVARQSTPSHAAQRSENKIELQRALESLDPIDREVLVLRHFKELTNSDAAQVLDISPTAANNRYMRALKRLQGNPDEAAGPGKGSGMMVAKHSDGDRTARIGRIADSFVERYRRGERPSIAELAARHPDLADEIREVFPALVRLEEAKGNPETRTLACPGAEIEDEANMPERLGDYRIVCQLGVAEWASCIKRSKSRWIGVWRSRCLLRTRCPKQLKRFHREAQSAAQLHHTNIVPVFDVGAERGIH